MIRYPIAEEELLARIEAEAPGWLGRSRKKTERFRAAKKYDESDGSWSEVKTVYMTLQHNKCAYCERRLEGEPYGTIEFDIEHFRPKNGVNPWPTERLRTERHLEYDFPMGGAYPAGYYMLAYAPLNYAVSCKICNTQLKSNYFPIGEHRRRPTDDVKRHASEKPYLIYPIDDVDKDDPERIITFEGILPVPRYKSGRKHRRARIIIDFFDLAGRPTLLRERAQGIISLHIALERRNEPKFSQMAELLTTAGVPHASCMRAFRALHDKDEARAREIFDLAFEYITSHSP